LAGDSDRVVVDGRPTPDEVATPPSRWSVPWPNCSRSPKRTSSSSWSRTWSAGSRPCSKATRQPARAPWRPSQRDRARRGRRADSCAAAGRRV